MYRRAAFALLIASLLLCAGTLAPAAKAADEKKPQTPAPRPVPAIQHVIIISCDGLRPDVLLRADAPNLRKMMAHGAFTLWSRTIRIAITLPSHTSMLTGVY